MKRFAKSYSNAENYFKTANLAGLSGALIDGDHSVTFSFGRDRPTEGNAFTENSLVAIGSLTKIFTAILVLQARHRGELTLDSAVCSFFPDSNYMRLHFSEVTIFDLMTHTSGLPRDLKGKFFETNDFPESSELTSVMEATSTVAEPRKRYRYSNLGFALLGSILERTSKKTYAELLRDGIQKNIKADEIVLGPTEMSKAGFYYSQDRSSFVPQPLLSLGGYNPTGGIWCSAKSLSKFFSALLNAPQSLGLSDVDLDRMFSVYFADSNGAVGPGFAWRFISIDGDRFFSHSGSLPGYGATVIASKELGRAVILMSNSDAFHFPAAHQLWKTFEKAPKHKAALSPAMVLSEFTGKYYWLDPQRTLTVAINSDGLLHLPDTSYKPLVSDTLFESTETKDKFEIVGGLNDGEYATFERRHDGLILGVWLGGTYYTKI